MKELFLNFSVDKLWALPPTEMLAFIFMALIAMVVALVVIGLVFGGIAALFGAICDGAAYFKKDVEANVEWQSAWKAVKSLVTEEK